MTSIKFLSNILVCAPVYVDKYFRSLLTHFLVLLRLLAAKFHSCTKHDFDIISEAKVNWGREFSKNNNALQSKSYLNYSKMYVVKMKMYPFPRIKRVWRLLDCMACINDAKHQAISEMNPFRILQCKFILFILYWRISSEKGVYFGYLATRSNKP